MNKTSNVIASTIDTSKLVRAKFGPGMLLQHEDLEQLNAYTRELSRLLFRSFFGCGVVCGLVVTPPVEECGKLYVKVGAGLALDCSGDPVHVPKDQRFAIDESFNPKLPATLWVVLCSKMKNCAPRTSICSDDDQAASVCTRERDMFEIRVVNVRPSCACGCNWPASKVEKDSSPAAKVSSTREEAQDPCLCADPTLDCHADHYGGICGCNSGGGSDCSCDCILLAQLDKASTESEWTADHQVRRFIRPVLMRDPQAEQEEKKRKNAKQAAQYTIDIAAASEDERVAHQLAARAAEVELKAGDEAKAAAALQVNRLAALREAVEQVPKVRAAAGRAKTEANRRRGVADRAAGADKAAADAAAAEAAANAENAAALAKQAAANAERANAEVEKATAEASAAELIRLKAAEDKIAADQEVASATEKVARLMRERIL